MSISMPNSSHAQICLPIIGYHRSPLSQKFGIPRQPNLVEVISSIDMIPPYHTPDAFEGLGAFSHLWISWQSHHNHPQYQFKPKVRPPRLGGNNKLGVFATRSTYRPSQLGLSVVRLLAIIQRPQGIQLQISGADMVDGTPIVDIKPYVRYSDAVTEAVSGFAPERPMMKEVSVTTEARQQFLQMVAAAPTKAMAESHLLKNSLSENRRQPELNLDDLAIIIQLIAQDPRPAYRQHEVNSVFTMRYKQCDVGFCLVEAGHLAIISVSPIASQDQLN